MKIVFVYESLCDSQVGVPYEVLHLGLALRNAGHDVLCIKGPSNKLPEIYQRAVGAGIRIENILLKDLKKIKEILALFEPDVAHVFYTLIPMNLLVCRELVRQNIPYVFEAHGSLNPQVFKFRFGGKKNSYYHELKKKIYRWTADRYIIHHAAACRALSESEAGLYQAHSKYLTYVVPYAISEEWYIKTSFHKKSENIKKFLFLARQDIYQKGIDLFLDAFEQLNLKGYADRYEALLAGPDLNGSVRELSLQLGKRRLDNVKCCEGLYGEEKEKAFGEADLFLCPSRCEGVPKTVREAMALGIPSLITRETNLADICNTNRSGIVAPLDGKVIAELLAEYLDKKIVLATSREIINGARKYTWSYVARKIEKVYQYVRK